MFDGRCEYTGTGTCVCEWYVVDWLTMLGSTGAGTLPKASNGRFGAPGKEDVLMGGVKFEGGWITKGWSETDCPVSWGCFLKPGGMEEFDPLVLDKGAVIAACGWLGCVGFGFGMGWWFRCPLGGNCRLDRGVVDVDDLENRISCSA